MKMRPAFLMACLALLGLSGCGGDDDDRGNGNAFLDVCRRNANSAAVKYGNPDPLQSDIKALFGGANGAPRDPVKSSIDA
jgi:hypothetical protein